MTERRGGWLERPGTSDRLFWGLVVVCVLLGLVDLVIRRHGFTPWESTVNFHGFFGFAAFWCIVIAGKHLRKLLWRPEDYYDD